jgi:phospholipase C
MRALPAFAATAALALSAAPLSAAAADGAPVAGSPIRHVIVLVQENRTTDNLFASSVLADGGPYPGANVTQTAVIDGTSIPMKAVPFEYPADPLHSHPALLAEWNHGRMDGFPQDPITTDEGYEKPGPNFPLAYLPANETTWYHLLAQRYALADNNFAPRLLPTYPSHMFLISGQSQIVGNPNNPVWGCDAPPGTTAAEAGVGEAMILPGIFPCFDKLTIGDLLDRAHVSWKYYTGSVFDVIDPAVNSYDAFRQIRYGPDWDRNVSMPSTNLLADIKDCKLPSVAWATPNWVDSDHAGNLSAAGPGWIASIYLAIEQSDRSQNQACHYYGDTAILLTWDDSGGWYDHVAPPPGPDGTSWGFRIPIIAISAWARSNYREGAKFEPYVSHTKRESTSILAFIEKNWALGNLGQRDATDDDLSDLFDYTRAQPIPPFFYLAVEHTIQRSGWDLATVSRDGHDVDDDQ